MSGRLQGKVAVITGGNSGIGLSTAELFAGEGARVVIFGRDTGSLQSAGNLLGNDCLVVQGNVKSIPDLDRLYGAVASRFGTIDVLVANAGIGKFAPIADCPESAN
jgi:NAD(P)-dependent dehydrogenase (short-subunit alcohol dehydrogenase family)